MRRLLVALAMSLLGVSAPGKLDASSTKVTVPTWGAGAFGYQEADGSAALVETDGYRIIVNQNNDSIGKFDALGICLHQPGSFKCGDGFE